MIHAALDDAACTPALAFHAPNVDAEEKDHPCRRLGVLRAFQLADDLDLRV